jgi:hypothetical protein
MVAASGSSVLVFLMVEFRWLLVMAMDSAGGLGA